MVKVYKKFDGVDAPFKQTIATLQASNEVFEQSNQVGQIYNVTMAAATDNAPTNSGEGYLKVTPLQNSTSTLTLQAPTNANSKLIVEAVGSDLGNLYDTAPYPNVVTLAGPINQLSSTFAFKLDRDSGDTNATKFFFIAGPDMQWWCVAKSVM